MTSPRVWNAINMIRAGGHSSTQPWTPRPFPHWVEDNRDVVLAPVGEQVFAGLNQLVPSTQDCGVFPPAQSEQCSPVLVGEAGESFCRGMRHRGGSCQAQNGDEGVDHMCKGLQRGLWFCADRSWQPDCKPIFIYLCFRKLNLVLSVTGSCTTRKTWICFGIWSCCCLS